VLYQAAKREVTAVAERDGVIYATAIGSKPSGASVTGPAPVLQATQPPVPATGAPRAGAQPPLLAPPIGSLTASVAGGSDLYSIQKDGFAERIWSAANDLAYAIAFDARGKVLVGTGNKGIIYRVDSDHLSTELLNAPATQVTAFLKGRNGAVYAVTGNVGNLYSIGPSLEAKGTLESDVLDANEFAYWGKAHVTAVLHGGAVGLETRSGNVSNPQNSWSGWSQVDVKKEGGPIESPPARFLQYRLTLSRNGGEVQSPDLSTIDIPFLPKNVAPKIQQIEIAPFNYRQAPTNSSLERSVTASGAPLTLTLPAVGRKRATTPPLAIDAGGSATLQYSKGWLTIRWGATDANADPLEYRVEIREKSSGRWRLLKDKLQDRFYAFDSTALPDGQYVIRVSASDAPGNPPADALTSTLESDVFTVDNTPPEITDVAINKSGTGRELHFTAKDALSWIDKAQYSVDGGEWILLEPDKFVTDSQVLQFHVSGQANQTLAVRVFDEDDNSVVRQFSLQ
jgi:hypothetical protein